MLTLRRLAQLSIIMPANQLIRHLTFRWPILLPFWANYRLAMVMMTIWLNRHCAICNTIMFVSMEDICWRLLRGGELICISKKTLLRILVASMALIILKKLCLSVTLRRPPITSYIRNRCYCAIVCARPAVTR